VVVDILVEELVEELVRENGNEVIEELVKDIFEVLVEVNAKELIEVLEEELDEGVSGVFVKMATVEDDIFSWLVSSVVDGISLIEEIARVVC